jgi:predicted nucleic acid-binding protein
VKLRIFIDTNVLIDFSHKIDDKSCRSFLKTFASKKFENVELVTSDYVLWEFYGHFKDELYARKLVKDHNYGIIAASKERDKSPKFRKANSSDMERFGKAIQARVNEFEEKPVSIQRLIGKQQNRFSDIVEAILQRSKFSYKDTIVFVSAILTQSQMIVTCDEDFSSERHLQSVKDALESLDATFKPEIQFKKPEEISTKNKAREIYRDWFLKSNSEKQIGIVKNFWRKAKTIEIDCTGDNFIEVGDYVLFVKFVKGIDFKSYVARVGKHGLRDSTTNRPLTKGKNVTWKLAARNFKPFMKGAMVFLLEPY